MVFELSDAENEVQVCERRLDLSPFLCTLPASSPAAPAAAGEPSPSGSTPCGGSGSASASAPAPGAASASGVGNGAGMYPLCRAWLANLGDFEPTAAVPAARHWRDRLPLQPPNALSARRHIRVCTALLQSTLLYMYSIANFRLRCCISPHQTYRVNQIINLDDQIYWSCPVRLCSFDRCTQPKSTASRPDLCAVCRRPTGQLSLQPTDSSLESFRNLYSAMRPDAHTETSSTWYSNEFVSAHSISIHFAWDCI